MPHVPPGRVTHSLAYRPEIDGLRALAVGAVILFHYFEDLAPGGYLGVDLFFVLSGYLITKIILTERAAGTFSLVGFYARRVRRILPALLAMIAATLAASYLLHTPEQAARVAVSALAAIGLAANFHFKDMADYFAIAATEEPLLHVWSLSVEEQFYLIWPAFLIALWAWRGPAGALLGIAVAVAAGWALSLYWSFWSVELAFFMAPSRIWELGAGALVAAAEPRLRSVGAPRARALLADLGLALIVLGLLLADRVWPTPALSASPVVLGATLVLAFGGAAVGAAGGLLTLRPMIAIGLLSYSLYLWHWPVLSFAAGLSPEPLGWSGKAAALMGSVALAWASLRFVEQPFRRPRTPSPPRRSLAAGGLAALLVAAFAAIGALSGGLPGRYPEASAALAAQQARDRAVAPPPGRCNSVLDFAPERCNFGAPRAGSFDLLLLGDSHAAHFHPAVAMATRAIGLSGRQATFGGCPPLLDVSVAKFGDRGYCADFKAFWPELLAANREARLVVLAARWSLYTEPLNLDGSRQTRFHVVGPDGRLRRSGVSLDALGRSLERTIQLLRAETDAAIVLLGEARPHRLSPARCVGVALWTGGDPAECEGRRDESDARLGRSDALLAQVAARSEDVYFVQTGDALCVEARCAVYQDGRLLYRDDNHLTTFGALQVGERIALSERFEAILAERSRRLVELSAGDESAAGVSD